ncbi:MAG: YncE family protein [Candidatus Nealsonbacteria bacterium]|nr:YncE family protein [Candidatus Nealsonbacteria bacterium]
MASDVARNRLYIASLSTNSVFVWDEVGQTALKTVLVGNKPWGVALVNDRVFVANSAGASISVIDASTMTKMGDIELAGQCDGGPTNVAVDPNANRVYIALYGSMGRIAIIDATSNKLAECLDTGASGTWGIAVDAWSRRLYATSRDAKSVIAFDISQVPAKKLNGVPTGGSPFFIAADPKTGRVWVTIAEDAPEFEEVNRLKVFEFTKDGLAIDPCLDLPIGNTHDGGSILIGQNSDVVYIAATAENELQVFDPVGSKVIQRVPMTDPFAIAENPGLDRIYVGSRAGNVVITIEGGPPPMP